MTDLCVMIDLCVKIELCYVRGVMMGLCDEGGTSVDYEV